MKYLGYIPVLLAAIAGFVHWHPAVVLPLALISVLLHASARRKALKEQTMAPDQNMILDGAFLLFSQILIMFLVFLLGYFASTEAGELFGKFFTGQR